MRSRVSWSIRSPDVRRRGSFQDALEFRVQRGRLFGTFADHIGGLVRVRRQVVELPRGRVGFVLAVLDVAVNMAFSVRTVPTASSS